MPLGLGSGVALPSKLLCEEPELGGIGAVNSPGDDGQGSVCKMSPGSMDGDGIARGPGTPRVTVPRWGARTSGVKRLAPAVEAWSGVQGTGRTSNAFSRARCSRLVALLCRRSHLRAAATKRRGRHHSGKPRQQANALEKRAHRRGAAVRIASPAAPAHDPIKPCIVTRHRCTFRLPGRRRESLFDVCLTAHCFTRRLGTRG
jgi:hypothetical protein